MTAREVPSATAKDPDIRPFSGDLSVPPDFADTAADRPLSEPDAERLVGAASFHVGPSSGRVGAELEWFVRSVTDPRAPVDFSRLRSAVDQATADHQATALPPGSPASTVATVDASPPAVFTSDAPDRADTTFGGRSPTAAAAVRQPSDGDVGQRRGRLPAGGMVTTEPGGQLELSTAPARSLARCVQAAHRDMALLRAALAGQGLCVDGGALDHLRRPQRVVFTPRYNAMETFFDRATGRWARMMMCSSASVQVCVDLGGDGDGPDSAAYRWHAAHRLGPVLVAMFANSPLPGGHLCGWASTRQLVWWRLDGGRTRAPSPTSGPDAVAAWVRYVLDAPVLGVCPDGQAAAGRVSAAADGREWYVPNGLTLRGWLRDGGRTLRRPSRADVELHLSTLFPPVRPRGGHLELRMIDQQNGDDGWVVPLAVATALFDDPVAAVEARRAVMLLDATGASPGTWWSRAARYGTSDAHLAAAARICVRATVAALPRIGVQASVVGQVESFADRYTERGRCPADDVHAGPVAARGRAG